MGIAVKYNYLILNPMNQRVYKKARNNLGEELYSPLVLYRYKKQCKQRDTCDHIVVLLLVMNRNLS